MTISRSTQYECEPHSLVLVVLLSRLSCWCSFFLAIVLLPLNSYTWDTCVLQCVFESRAPTIQQLEKNRQWKWTIVHTFCYFLHHHHHQEPNLPLLVWLVLLFLIGKPNYTFCSVVVVVVDFINFHPADWMIHVSLLRLLGRPVATSDPYYHHHVLSWQRQQNV